MTTDPAAGPVTYRRLSPLTPVVRAPIVLLAVVGGSWQQLISQDEIGFTALLLLGLLLVGGGYGVASWVRTKYWIHDDELRIDTGVLFRQSRRIRIDRLQGIDIVQPLVARIFGLAELKFDLASGGDREGSLAFLPHAEALALRRRLLERRDVLRGAPQGASVAGGPDAGVDADPATVGQATWPAPQERLLGTLDLGLLAASLALSSELLWMSAVLVGLVVSFVTLGSFAAAGGLLPALLALGVALSRKFSGYYGFRLLESGEGLHVRRGLTALSSQTIAPTRIQGIVVQEPVLWRRFGWARLDVSVAGYRSGDGDTAAASSTLMPVAPLPQVLGLAAHVLGRGDPAAVPLVRPPRRARWRSPLTAWTFAAGADAALAVSRRGFWSRRLDVVPHARVQSVRISQGPLQRLLRLADVHVDSPPGPVQVRARHVDVATARPLADRLVATAREARREQPAAGTQSTVGATPPAPESTQ